MADPNAKPFYEKLNDEHEEAYGEVAARQELVEPTDEEKRNGWTAEALTAYLTEQQTSQSLSVDVHSLKRQQARRPNVQNHRYSPHRWRE